MITNLFLGLPPYLTQPKSLELNICDNWASCYLTPEGLERAIDVMIVQHLTVSLIGICLLTYVPSTYPSKFDKPLL